LDALFGILMWSVVLAGLALLIGSPAFVWWRHRKSERVCAGDTCGSCGYDLRGLPSTGPCPECGNCWRTSGKPQRDARFQQAVAFGTPMLGPLILFAFLPGWALIVCWIVFVLLIAALLSMAHRVSILRMATMAIIPTVGVTSMLALFATGFEAEAWPYILDGPAAAVLLGSVVLLSTAGWGVAAGALVALALDWLIPWVRYEV
jgi:hypothetical protein